MPIETVFKRVDLAAYHFSIEIDDSFEFLVNKLFLIKETITASDFCNVLANYQEINTLYNFLNNKLTNSREIKLSRYGLENCNNYLLAKSTEYKKKYGNNYNFSMLYIERASEMFHEVASLIKSSNDIDKQIVAGTKINFAYLVYKNELVDNLLSKILTDEKILSEEKQITLEFFNKNEINRIAKLLRQNFMQYVENNIYKKLYNTTEEIGTLLQVKTEVNFQKCIRLSIKLNELSNYYKVEAKGIFKKDYNQIIQEIHKQAIYLVERFKLLPLNMTELQILDRLALTVETELITCHAEDSFQTLITKIKKDFPELKKEEFIKMVNNRLLKHFYEKRDDNYFSKKRYQNFAKLMGVELPKE